MSMIDELIQKKKAESAIFAEAYEKEAQRAIFAEAYEKEAQRLDIAVAQLRKELGITQRELAEKVGKELHVEFK